MIKHGNYMDLFHVNHRNDYEPIFFNGNEFGKLCGEGTQDDDHNYHDHNNHHISHHHNNHHTKLSH